MKMTGIEIIAEERARQIEEEGFTVERDYEENATGMLSAVAACYAFAPKMKDSVRNGHNIPVGMYPEEWLVTLKLCAERDCEARSYRKTRTADTSTEAANST